MVSVGTPEVSPISWLTSPLGATSGVLRPWLEGRDRARDGRLFAREFEPDLELGDGERRMCNLSRKEGRGLNVPEIVSGGAAPT